MGLPAEPVAPGWGLARRVLFRFVFAYFVLYILPFPLDAPVALAPGSAVGQFIHGWISQPLDAAWNAAVVWTSQAVFGVEITVRPNGSGDTTWNYVQVSCIAALSAGATFVWSLIDRRRTNHTRLHETLRLLVRFDLAAQLITYGSIKVIQSQFPAPAGDGLLASYGESSPMRLLWTFMGASEGYNWFTGGGELLAGLLLTTRRTTLLGALVAFGVMLHVAALNFCYDVPVKLFSLHLVAMSVFLMAPDLPWLARVFVLGRPAEPRGVTPLFGRHWANVTFAALRTAAVLAFVTSSLVGAYGNRAESDEPAGGSPLRGVWLVEEFEADGATRPPLTTDAGRWHYASFGRRMRFGTFFVVRSMTGTTAGYLVEVSPEAGTITLSRRTRPPEPNRPPEKSVLKYHEPEPGRVVLDGPLEGYVLRVTMRRIDESQFLLLSRGFHWINEYPFNRTAPTHRPDG